VPSCIGNIVGQVLFCKLSKDRIDQDLVAVAGASLPRSLQRSANETEVSHMTVSVCEGGRTTLSLNSFCLDTTRLLAVNNLDSSDRLSKIWYTTSCEIDQSHKCAPVASNSWKRGRRLRSNDKKGVVGRPIGTALLATVLFVSQSS
jgi:hypothetical protein